MSAAQGEQLTKLDSAVVSVRWGVKDVIAYALGTGAVPESRGLAFVYEALGPELIPAFASYLASRWVTHQRRALGSSWGPAVLVRQSWRLHHRPLPAAGSADLHWGIRSVGATRRGAVIETGAELRGVHGLLVTISAVGLVRHVPRDAVLNLHQRRQRLTPPERSEDEAVQLVTFPQQAATFRLLLDLDSARVPADALHIDPAAAAEAGFPRPVLHGLAVEGLVLRGCIEVAFVAASEVVAMDTEFVGPLVPGDDICLRMWRTSANTVTVAAATTDGMPIVVAALTLDPERAK